LQRKSSSYIHDRRMGNIDHIWNKPQILLLPHINTKSHRTYRALKIARSLCKSIQSLITTTETVLQTLKRTKQDLQKNINKYHK